MFYLWQDDRKSELMMIDNYQHRLDLMTKENQFNWLCWTELHQNEWRQRGCLTNHRSSRIEMVIWPKREERCKTRHLLRYADWFDFLFLVIWMSASQTSESRSSSMTIKDDPSIIKKVDGIEQTGNHLSSKGFNVKLCRDRKRLANFTSIW